MYKTPSYGQQVARPLPSCGQQVKLDHTINSVQITARHNNGRPSAWLAGIFKITENKTKQFFFSINLGLFFRQFFSPSCKFGHETIFCSVELYPSCTRVALHRFATSFYGTPYWELYKIWKENKLTNMVCGIFTETCLDTTPPLLPQFFASPCEAQVRL